MVELLRYVGCELVFGKDELTQPPDSFAVVARNPGNG
jgi:hypothetical protein